MYRWAGVEEITPTSLGSYVDARSVNAMEKFVGSDFESYSWGNTPGTAQSAYLMDVFDGFIKRVDSEIQTNALYDEVSTIVVSKWDEVNEKWIFDAEGTRLKLEEAEQNGNANSKNKKH